MAASWDKRSSRRNASLRDELVRAQVRLVGGGAAYWKQRFADLGRAPASIKGVADLAALAAVGERDVSPTGDPAAMAGLVVHGGERQFALHASGPDLRRALRRRVTSRADYHRIVAADTRPTTFVFSGLGFRYPLASTRGDLDVLTRAGARLWQVLGLSSDDALLSALPVAASVEHTALHYAALGAGAAAVFPGDDIDDVTEAAELAPPTVLAVDNDAAADVVSTLAETGAVRRLTTVLLVGAPSDEERESVRDALTEAGVQRCAILAVHAPSGARLLWAECRESDGASGLHTYPDLDVAQVIDPDTADAATTGGELVLTQLGMRGSALLRWRTGDLVDEVTTSPCPACGRTVPRVVGVRRQALVLQGLSGRAVDVRTITAALSGRPDVDDWRLVVGGRGRDGRGQVVVHLAAGGDPGDVAVATAADIRAVAGRLPTQLVAADRETLAHLPGEPLTDRVLVRE